MSEQKTSERCIMCGKSLSPEILEAAKLGGLEICEECMEIMLRNHIWV